MKPSDIVVGGVYRMRLPSSGWINARVDAIQKPQHGRHTHYLCTNLNTGREIRVKSALKFKHRVTDTK